MLRCLLILFALPVICPASRVTWVVENIDKVRRAWEALGLTAIEEYPNIQLVGQYRGRPVTIYAWQITGHLGNLTVDMIQPAEGQANAYTSFLGKHGDGIFSIVQQVPNRQALEQEILRMKAKGVDVLQQVTLQRGQSSISYTYFHTEPEGKFALGLIDGLEQPPLAASDMVSHFGPEVRDAASVSAYWQSLGFTNTRFAYESISPNEHQREGIHHIGVAVPDLAKAIAAYEKLGYHVQQSGARSVYMDTDSAGGIVVELIRTPPPK